MTKLVAPAKAKTADDLALEQREISVAEFFEKNRHLLGFDNPAKALLTVTKEAVDNSLDACEEARILPEIKVKIKDRGNDRFEVEIEDNGPGIVKTQIANIFGSLLYGSKFHKLRQSRGQQGIGISASVLYAQLTTGKPAIILSKPKEDGPTYETHLMIDVTKNRPEIVKQEESEKGLSHTGIRITLDIEGKYVQRYHSVDEYLRQTAISNPYAHIIYYPPVGEKAEYKRKVNELPKLPTEIKPHPQGIELGILKRMLKASESRKLSGFLQNSFSKIGSTAAEEICRLSSLDPARDPKTIEREEAEKLVFAMGKVKLMRPPTDCLSPLGEQLMEKSLQQEVKCEFVTSITREPSVYRGQPFQVEAAMAYGGELKKAEGEEQPPVEIMRFANRVPLLYQFSDCATTKAISQIQWRRYGLDQPGSSGVPKGPALIFIHMCSTWVPFTSESKEAIASYQEIIKEIKLAVQECARKMVTHIHKGQRAKRETERLRVFDKYFPLVVSSAKDLAESKEKLDFKELMEKVVNKQLVEMAEETKELDEEVKKTGKKRERKKEEFDAEEGGEE